MTIIERLLESAKSNGYELTIREITGGHSKGQTGVYHGKIRYVCWSRKDLIKWLVFFGKS